MRYILVALGLGALPACAADDAIEIMYDPCAPLTLSVATDSSSGERLGVEGAAAVWADVLPTQLVIGVGARGPGVLPIRFEAGDTFYRGIYWDAFGEIAIGRDQLAPEDYPLAIAHELGHAFGLQHVEKTDRPSVMNVGNLEIAPTQDDAAALRTQWESCRDPYSAE